jgi:hypothetical protein
LITGLEPANPYYRTIDETPIAFTEVFLPTTFFEESSSNCGISNGNTVSGGLAPLPANRNTSQDGDEVAHSYDMLLSNIL